MTRKANPMIASLAHQERAAKRALAKKAITFSKGDNPMFPETHEEHEPVRETRTETRARSLPAWAIILIVLAILALIGTCWFTGFGPTLLSRFAPQPTTQPGPAAPATCQANFEPDLNALASNFPAGTSFDPLYEDPTCSTRVTAYVAKYTEPANGVTISLADLNKAGVKHVDWWNGSQAFYGTSDGTVLARGSQVTLRP